MSRDDLDLVERFRRIRHWRRGGARAPHKTLLLLVALARVQRGEPRLMPYRDPSGAHQDLESKLTELLREYGPPRRTHHPSQPFWRLQSDGLWEVPGSEELIAAGALDSKGNARVSFLRDHRAEGGFPEDIDAALRADPALVRRLAGMLLDDNFPSTLHEEILDAVGMPWVVVDAVVDTVRRRRRDPGFREAVLRIYEYRCAVCGYAGRLGQQVLNLEAAHIKWHGFGGPDDLDNGVAMCTFHHRAFDRGAIGLDAAHRILISQHVNGDEHTENWLLRWSGQALRGPQPGQPRPAAHYMAWHRREVFREPARVAGVLNA